MPDCHRFPRAGRLRAVPIPAEGGIPIRLRKTRIILSVLVSAGLAGAYLFWRLTSPEQLEPAQRACSLISLLLFAGMILRLLPEWLGALCPERRIDPVADVSAAGGPDRPRYARTRAMLLFLGSLVFHLALVCVLRIATGMDDRPADTLRIWNSLDSRHYLNIAADWYTHAEGAGELLELVFFPGYPVLVGITALAVPDLLLSGFLASWIPFLAAGPVLYELLRLDYDHRKTMRILLLICLTPASVFFSYPMSESLFLLCCAACLYLTRKRRWFGAGVCGMLAVLTRSAGVLLLLPMGMELVSDTLGDPSWRHHLRGRLQSAACLLLLPVGLLLYLHINSTMGGDPFRFLEYQKSNWYQQLTWFFHTASVQAGKARETWLSGSDRFRGLWMPNLIVGYASLLIMLISGKKLRPSSGFWFAGYFAFSYGTTWLLSGPRYMAVFFPLSAAADELPLPRWVIPVVFAACNLYYTACFALRWGVW